MTGRINNKISATGNDDAHGSVGRIPRVPRRVSSCPLPLAPGVLTDIQFELVREVIVLAEAADLAEALRAKRRPPSEFGDCRAPDFGSDVSEYLPVPETREAKDFIDSQCLEDRVMLLAVMNAGRSSMNMTAANVAWLLSNASSSAESAGSYMTGKTNLVSWLKEGLRKFESYTNRMIRRGGW